MTVKKLLTATLALVIGISTVASAAASSTKASTGPTTQSSTPRDFGF